MGRYRIFTTSLIAPLLAAAIVVAGMPGSPAMAAFAGGAGTVADPYQIADCTQLAEIDDSAANLAAHYLLTANITCSGSFTPLKSGTTYFSGSLNGGSFAVSGLSISCGATSMCGMFAATSTGASISNLTLTSPSVSSTVASADGGSPYASLGALVGEAKGNLTLSSITIDTPSISATGDAVGGILGFSPASATLSASNVSVTGGTVAGGVAVGGLFGWVNKGSIANASSSTAVSALGAVGGIVGQGGNTSYTGVVTIDQATVTETVTASLYATIRSYAGGVAGNLFGTAAESSRVTRSQVTAGGISGDGVSVGGLIGNGSYLIVANSHATVTVDGNKASTSTATGAYNANVGGLIGQAQVRTLISQSYFDGTVTSTNVTNRYREMVGGLIGHNQGSTAIAQSYSLGSVTGSSYVGGLVGYGASAEIALFNSYSRATINYAKYEASDYEAGLIGDNTLTATSSPSKPKQVSTIFHSYFAGVLSPSGSSTAKYGLYGQGRIACTRSFFDTQTSGATFAAATVQYSSGTYGNYCGSPLGVGTTTANMQTQATYVDWDFTNVWSHASGQYPALRMTSGTSASSPDLTAPAAPAAPDLAAGSDTGSSATDNLTLATSLEVSTTTAEDGGVVRFVANGPSDAKQQCSVTVTSSAATCTIPNIQSGTWSITTTHFDLAGNASSSSSALSVSVDTTVPSRSSFTPAANATNVALDAVITLTFSEDILAGTGNILIYSGSSCSTTFATYAATDAEISISSRVVTIDPATNFSMGTKYCVTYTGTAFKDAVDNYAAALSSTSTIYFTALSDVTAPAAPNTPDLDAASDLGQTSTDNLTADNTPSITVIATEAGGTVTVTAAKTGSSNVTCTLAGSTSGNSCTLGTLADGVWTLTAVHVDAAGNASSASSALSITIDTVAPTRTAVNPTDGSTGASTGVSPVITFNDTVISGGGNIVIYSGASCATTVATIASSDAQVTISGSTVTINPTAEFAQNTKHCITYAASAFTDIAGNQVAALSLAAGDSDFSFTSAADTTAPSAPGLPDLDAASDSGRSSTDDITSDDTPTITVTATESGGTVTVTATKSGETDVTCTMGGSPSGGTCTLGTMADGTWTIRATHTDAAGNASSASSALTVTVDTTAPTRLSFTPTAGAINVAINSSPTITFDEAVVGSTGNFVIYEDSTCSTISLTISGTDSQITASGSTLTINPSGDFALITQYCVTYGSTAITDLAGNAVTALSSTATFSFTTSSTPPATTPPAVPTTTTIPSTTRTLSITGAASSYLVTQAGPGLTAAPSAGGGAISWSSLTPGVCSIGSVAMMSILSKQSSVSVGRLNTVGTCSIRATIAATTTHDAASSTVSFAVTRIRPTLRLTVRELSPEDQFFLRITLPSALASNVTLLEQMYAAVNFESTTPDACEVDIITAYDESIARYGSTWAGVHVSVNRFGSDACGVRAELPLGVRWFRVSSDPASMSGTSTTTTSTTVSPTTTVAASTTTVPRSSTTVAGSVTTVATTAPGTETNTPSGEPSLTSFAPTPTTVPVVELDLAAQIIIDTDVTRIVISGDSIESSARGLNVTTGFVRIRPNTGEWTQVSLPRPADVTIVLTAETTSLDVRFEPLDGEPILVSVPLAIVVNDSRTWLYALVAFVLGSAATVFWFAAAKRRRKKELPPPAA